MAIFIVYNIGVSIFFEGKNRENKKMKNEKNIFEYDVS